MSSLLYVFLNAHRPAQRLTDLSKGGSGAQGELICTSGPLDDKQNAAFGVDGVSAEIVSVPLIGKLRLDRRPPLLLQN